MYKKKVEAGTGKKIPEDGRVYCKYGVFFPDGNLFETNDDSHCGATAELFPATSSSAAVLQGEKDDESIVNTLSGICIGETISYTSNPRWLYQRITYGDKGRAPVLTNRCALS